MDISKKNHSGRMMQSIKRHIHQYLQPVVISCLLLAACNAPNPGSSENQGNTAVNPDSLKAADSIEYAFNYQNNKKPFKLTFVEVGSTGCIECKKMEKVMDSVRNSYRQSVQTVFYNVRNNKKMTTHFGVKMIPVQILLNDRGKECFRHTGYFPFNDLSAAIDSILQTQHQ
jgi:thioredoxin 1